ncbi:MAG: RNA methyltransferase [Flavobacteriaceae bacterium]|nr:RNA methyltransferase [Flavobacteriaceae bacterium]
MHKQITSIHNSLVKEIVQLQEKSRVRKKKGVFIIEGVREISLALKGNYHMQSIWVCEDIISLEKANSLLELTEQTEFIIISKEVYQKISHRKTTEGIIAVAKAKEFDLSNLKLPSTPLILIAEAPEKPGNIGALLRTADAANLDAVIIANPKTDLYNPNIIRSSVGCVFTANIATGTTGEIIDLLKQKNINTYAASLSENSIPYTEINFKKASAIIVGTESTGLSDKWLNNATKKIIIPMQGEIDSLNVSVSAAILIFEAKRQRNIN